MWLPNLDTPASYVGRFFKNRSFAQIKLTVEERLVVVFLRVFLHFFVDYGRHLNREFFLFLVLDMDRMCLCEEFHYLRCIFSGEDHTVEGCHQQSRAVLRLLLVELCHLIIQVVSLRKTLSEELKAELVLHFCRHSSDFNLHLALLVLNHLFGKLSISCAILKSLPQKLRSLRIRALLQGL